MKYFYLLIFICSNFSVTLRVDKISQQFAIFVVFLKPWN